MVDLIIRNTEIRVCDRCFDCRVTCLPGVKAAGIMQCLDRLKDTAGEESMAMVHDGANDIDKCNPVVMEETSYCVES